MKPDEVATIMLSVSPFKAALSSENATNETHPQHNHALDIQPDVQAFPASGSGKPKGSQAPQVLVPMPPR
jgi:hypothetical protein